MRIRITRQCVVQGTPAPVGTELDLDEKTATILVQMRRAEAVGGAAPAPAPQEVIEEATQPRRTRKSE